jgi:hypothetical protein
MATVDLAAVDTASRRCSVEVPIGGLDQPSGREVTVRRGKLLSVVNVCAGTDPDAHNQGAANIAEIPEFLIMDICFSP